MENKYYFCATDGGFYIHPDSEIIPVDAVEITADIFSQFAGVSWPEGKVLGADDSGIPVWIDAPPPSAEEIAEAAAVKKSQLRVIADSEIAWRQDAVDAGIATAEETAALTDWKTYRVLLMRIDTTAPVWPTPPGEKASQD